MYEESFKSLLEEKNLVEKKLYLVQKKLKKLYIAKNKLLSNNFDKINKDSKV